MRSWGNVGVLLDVSRTLEDSVVPGDLTQVMDHDGLQVSYDSGFMQTSFQVLEEVQFNMQEERVTAL